MKRILIGAAVVLVVAGGAGAYTLFNKDKAADGNKTVSVSTKSGTATSEQASIEDLLTRNASLKCTYSVNEGEITNTGTAYFAGGKNMYGEFVTTADNKNTSVFIVRNGDTQYVWMKDSTTGFKTDVSAYGKEQQQQMSQQFDATKKYQFNCVNWTKDDSKFTPPSSVTFLDTAAQQ